MEGRVLVADAAFVDHPRAFGALLGVVAFVARHTDDAVVARHEAFVADGVGALRAGEALVVPVAAFVLKLLHASAERLVAAVTPGGEVVVVAVGAVDLLVLGGERLVHQGQLAGAALEAKLVPVALLV